MEVFISFLTKQNGTILVTASSSKTTTSNERAATMSEYDMFSSKNHTKGNINVQGT